MIHLGPVEITTVAPGLILGPVEITTASDVATVAPTISTPGGTSISQQVGDAYSDPAWTATDDLGSVAVVWSGDTVDTATLGVYTRTATATNTFGTTAVEYSVTVAGMLGLNFELRAMPSGEVFANATGIKVYEASDLLVSDGVTDSNGQMSVSVLRPAGDTVRVIVETQNGELMAACIAQIEDAGGE